MSLSGRRVLVTGAGGFIGSHLAERLVIEGADVRAFVHYNALGSSGWLEASPERSRMEVVAGDICDRDSVARAIEGCDTVFHLAALIAIPYSYTAPASYVRTNIDGTMNVLLAAREHRVRRVIHTSTSEVYGTARYLPIDEDHPLHGQSPYSATKIGADKLAEAFHLSFDVPVVTIRPFNTFGPRQSARAVIPTILTQLLAGKQSIQLGRLDPKRDLTFVSDTVDGFIRGAVAEGIEGETIQLGAGRTFSIAEIFEASCEVVGVQAEAVQREERLRPDRSEVMILLSNPAKARKLLGWEATTSLRDGLAETVRWLGATSHAYDSDRYHV